MNNLTIDQKNLLIMALKGYELNIIKLKDFRFIDSKHADETIKDINIIFNLLTNPKKYEELSPSTSI